MAADSLQDGTFHNLMTQGTQLFRLKEYDKALRCFNNALKLRQGDKDCLVAHSKCYLKLGDVENSMKNAEASLKDDKTFFKGVYQRAETLYLMGDFELALVFYHQGHRLRPDQQKFRLGIEKCQEAINNCIRSPSSVKLENKAGLCFISRQAESRKANQKLQIKRTKDEKRTKKQVPVRNPKAERQFLGEFYAEKLYLEKLLKDKDLMESSTKQGIKVADLVLSGISYLETHSEFWRQQNPIYARVRERKLRQQRWIRDKKLKAAEVGRYIAKSMEDIEMLQGGDCPQEICKKAEHVLKIIQGLSDDEIPNKNELIGNLHSCIGAARLEMGKMKAALQSHKMDLEVARKNNLPDSVSRALENIGRIYVRMRKFQQAIDTWEEKVPMAKSNLEKAWLFHEIGRCYFELKQAEAACDYGEKSLQLADEEGDAEWQLHAVVLLAQARVQLKDYHSAIMYFEKALQKAKLIHNQAAQEAILAALENVSKSFFKELKEREAAKGYYSSSENTEDDNSEMYGEEEKRRQSTENHRHGKQKGARNHGEEHGNEDKASGGEKRKQKKKAKKLMKSSRTQRSGRAVCPEEVE